MDAPRDSMLFMQIQTYCLGKDGAVEEYPWGHIVWKVKGKIFGIWSSENRLITVKSTPQKQAALIMHPSISVASHVGRFGWVSVHVQDQETLELAKDLVDESYASIQERRRPKRRP